MGETPTEVQTVKDRLLQFYALIKDGLGEYGTEEHVKQRLASLFQIDVSLLDAMDAEAAVASPALLEAMDYWGNQLDI